MKNKTPRWLFVILLCVVVAGISILGTGIFFISTKQITSNPNGNNSGSSSSDFGYSKLTEIQKLVDRYYVGDYNKDEVLDYLSDAMIAAIGDKWAYYTPADLVPSVSQSLSGKYCGIGITVTNDDSGMLRIIEVSDNSPAEKAGIRTMDLLYSVEGNLVSEIGRDSTVKLVQGEPDTIVNIQVMRDGKILDFAVKRAEIQTTSVTSEIMDSSVGYLRIKSFTTVAAEQFSTKLKALLDSGITALIVDVRNDGGGSMSTLLSTLDELIPSQVIFIKESYDGTVTKYSTDDKCTDLPLVVLANEYSISAAEYFAAVCQETGRAKVIGTHTTGKGVGQSTFELSDGSTVSFSTIRYYLPSGISLDEQGGFAPDLSVEMTDEQVALIGSVPYEEDPQIVAALDYLSSLSR